MKRRAFISSIISMLVWMCSAQSLDFVVPFATSLEKNGQFADAIVEYNRAIFLGAEPQDELFQNIADCYFRLGNFSLAESFYDKAYFSSNNDSLKNEIILSKAYALLLHNDFMIAKSELYSVESVYNVDQHKRLLFLTAFSEFGSEQFDASKGLFNKLALMKDSATALAVDEAFDHFLSYAHSRRPHKVEIMSYIIPGSGQAYIGEWKESANSIVLVGGLIYGLFRFAQIYTPIDGLMLFGPWIQRYYQGGAEKAHGLAHRRIQEKKNEAFNNLVELCLDD